MLFGLAMIVLSIVSGVYMWKMDAKGPLLSKIFCIITLALNLLALIILLDKGKGDKVFLVFISSIFPSLILYYLFKSRRILRDYGKLEEF